MTNYNLLDGEPSSDLFIPIVQTESPRPRMGKAADSLLRTLPAADTKCAEIPVDTPKSRNTSYTLETDQAAQLGINYLGTVSADIDRKMKVFVREFMKYNTCESTDGKATLVYGAVWRATVLIDQTDAAGKVNFAVVAASATLKSIAVQVQINQEGFVASDRAAIEQASADAMAATTGGLNVTTFVKFSEQVEKAIGAAMKANATTPLQLIAIKLRDTNQFLESVARTVALAHIARGHSCLEAIAALPVKNNDTEKAIRDTYDALSSKPCDASDKMVQLAAQRLIEGVKVPLSFW